MSPVILKEQRLHKMVQLAAIHGLEVAKEVRDLERSLSSFNKSPHWILTSDAFEIYAVSQMNLTTGSATNIAPET